MRNLPTGTVTFLFTDVSGSTLLWERAPEAMRAALARHDQIADEIVQRHDGEVVRERGEGDSLFAVFARATDGVAAAVELQRAYLQEQWAGQVPLRVRMALHTGEAELRAGDYYGSAVNRCARVRSLGEGGQILLSQTVYDIVRDALPSGVGLRDLGDHRLRDLRRPEHIYQVVHPELPAEFPPLRSLSHLPNNLPQQLTSFVGREREIKQIQELLTGTRLLTITGAGGTGKTRLSLQVAADLLDDDGDGVWLIELAPLTDANLVPQAVASILDVREEPGRPMVLTLVDAIHSKRLLLLFDNCEHVCAACAELANVLLQGCPDARILATSREALGIAGETVYRLPSLSLPDPAHLPSLPRMTQFESVRLFIDRAVAASPQFAVTNTNAPAVAQICHRLDGIPLALELAAARIKALTPEQILRRLDDRFRLLTGGSRTAMPRQQTLRALIDWSFDLLSPQERAMLRRLSVFSGGWSMEAAEVVCSLAHAGEGANAGTVKVEEWEILDLLTGLVDKSLVLCEESGSTSRYRLLQTVREYARERLMEAGETEAVRRSHLEYYLKLAERAEPELRGPKPEPWLDQLEQEHDNLRIALLWCRSVRGETTGTENSSNEAAADPCLRIVGALWRFWHIRGYYQEGRERLSEILAEASKAPTELRAQALNAAGLLTLQQGDYDSARSFFEQCLAIGREIGSLRFTSAALGNLGMVAQDQGNYVAARALYDESLAIDRKVNNPRAISNALMILGNLLYAENDDEEARRCYEESLQLRRTLGDKWGISGSLNNLGNVAYRQSNYAAARAYYAESLDLYRQLGDKRGMCIPLSGLGKLSLREMRLPEAAACYTESLGYARELGLKPTLVLCLDGLAGVALAKGHPDRAARILGATEALRTSVGAALPPPEPDDHELILLTLRESLGERALSEARNEGRRMDLEHAVVYALIGAENG